MLRKEIKIGLKSSTEILVGTRDTAFHVGSGKIKVLATPVLVMLMEEAALNAVEGFFESGYQTVGTRLDLSHTAATPVGMRVEAFAEMVEVDCRNLTFRIWADDEKGRIGQGVHKRMIVNVERFDQRVAAKLD